MSDVAARAGVSKTTVSHVLNNLPGKRIGAETRARVRAAAAELDYVPNEVARSLRIQRTQTLAVVSDEVLTTPFAVDMITGAQEAASGLGWLLFLVNTGVDRALEAAEIEALKRRRVDGFVYMRMYHHAQVDLPAGLHGLPTVLVNGTCSDQTISSIVPDEIDGGLNATLELVRRGHSLIAFINSVDDIPASRGRLAGYRAALEQAGVRLRPEYVVDSHTDSRGGYQAADHLLGLDEPPTAIFAFSDRIALGVYHAAVLRGLRIPDDLSVIGFDNQHSVADGLFPGLTTMAIPHREMGAWGVRALVRRIEEQPSVPAEHVALPCPVVVRESVAPPPVRPRPPGALRPSEPRQAGAPSDDR
jgi:LacI family transcriptional regulator